MLARQFVKLGVIGALFGLLALVPSKEVARLLSADPAVIGVAPGIAKREMVARRAARCSELLARVATFFSPKSQDARNHAWIGTYGDIRALLGAANVPPGRADRYVEYLARVAALAKDPLLLETIDEMEKSKKEAKFFLCLAGEGCRVAGDNFAFLYIPNEQGRFRIVPHAHLAAEIERLKAPGAAGREKGKAIALSRPENDDPMDMVDWISSVYHEFTHYRDTRLLRDWMHANLDLKGRGQETDPFFQHAVVEVEGVPYLSAEFVSLFLESRAHYISAESAKLILHPSMRADYEKRRKEKAYQFLRGTLGAGYLQRWGVEQENVLGAWRPIEAGMRKTLVK